MECSSFTPEKAAQFEKYYEEEYDVENPEYRAWLRINHPDDCNSAPSESSSSSGPFGIPAKSSDIGDVLVLPHAQATKPSNRKKKGINQKTICITDDEVLSDLIEQEREKELKIEEKVRK